MRECTELRVSAAAAGFQKDFCACIQLLENGKSTDIRNSGSSAVDYLCVRLHAHRKTRICNRTMSQVGPFLLSERIR